MFSTHLLIALLSCLVAYLLGSISFAVVFSRLFSHKDVRDFGSGNAGMTNVMRVSGALPGILTFVFDFLKGFASAYLGGVVFSYLFEATSNPVFHSVYGQLVCAFFCMLGHVFPVFFKFRGGKGVATGVGAFFAICPIAAATGFGVFAVLFLITGIISLSSLMGTASVVVVFLILMNTSINVIPQIVLSASIALIIFIKHKENIIRLIHGEEKKLKVKKK